MRLWRLAGAAYAERKAAIDGLSRRRRGLGVDQLPAVVHDRQAGEAHARILPRQPLVRDVAPHLGRGFLCRPRHARRARRLAPLNALRALQVLQLDHVAVAHAGVALQVRFQTDVRVTVAQLALGVEHEVLGRAQVGGQKPLNYLFAVDESRIEVWRAIAALRNSSTGRQAPRYAISCTSRPKVYKSTANTPTSR